VKKLLWLLPLLALYVVGYVALVNTHEPSINDSGEFVYRSSYPKVSRLGMRLQGITWLFPKAGPANWIFLPIDQCWRRARGLPASRIENNEIDWQEYFEYLIASGLAERSKCKPQTSSEASRVVGSGATEARRDAADYVIAKLEKIVIPVIDFEDLSIEEAIDFLRMRSFELELGEPETRGISWINGNPMRDPADNSAEALGPVAPNQVPKINYRAKDVGLLTAVEEIARQAHLDVYLTNVGIVICGPGEPPLPVGKMDGEEIWKTIHKEVLPHTIKTEGEQADGKTPEAPQP